MKSKDIIVKTRVVKRLKYETQTQVINTHIKIKVLEVKSDVLSMLEKNEGFVINAINEKIRLNATQKERVSVINNKDIYFK